MARNIDYFNKYKDTPILVTGGAGFIGSKLVKRLINHNAKVTIIDNFTNSSLSNLAQVIDIDKVEIIEDSIENFNACLKATYNKKIVFHMAAIASIGQCEQNKEKCYNTNINGTFNILEASRVNKVSKVIFSSSSAVYGNCLTICKENMPCKPISNYGYSKLMGETLCKQYTNLYNLDTAILRYFNVYDQDQKSNHPNASVIARFKYNIENNKAISIFGDGTQTRDFVNIDTVIKANLKIASPYIYAPGEIFNIASGKSINLLDLFNKLKHLNPNFRQEIKFEAARSGDIEHSSADINKYNNLEENYLSNYFYNKKVKSLNLS